MSAWRGAREKAPAGDFLPSSGVADPVHLFGKFHRPSRGDFSNDRIDGMSSPANLQQSSGLSPAGVFGQHALDTTTDDKPVGARRLRRFIVGKLTGNRFADVRRTPKRPEGRAPVVVSRCVPARSRSLNHRWRKGRVRSPCADEPLDHTLALHHGQWPGPFVQPGVCAKR